MTARVQAVDDFAIIRARMAEIERAEHSYGRGECSMRAGGAVSQCWCYKAGPNGINLPCPPVTEV